MSDFFKKGEVMEFMKIKSVCISFAILVMFSGNSIAQSAVYSTSAEDKAWVGDMEGKVEATIKVLSVIKEELEEEKKQLSQGQDVSETDWPESLRKTIQRLKRVWAEVNKIRQEELKKTGTVPADEKDQKEWTNEISNKLKKGIKAMQVIKEELDEMEKEKN